MVSKMSNIYQKSKISLAERRRLAMSSQNSIQFALRNSENHAGVPTPLRIMNPTPISSVYSHVIIEHSIRIIHIHMDINYLRNVTITSFIVPFLVLYVSGIVYLFKFILA